MPDRVGTAVTGAAGSWLALPSSANYKGCGTLLRADLDVGELFPYAEHRLVCAARPRESTR